jgi:hypothetical protein
MIGEHRTYKKGDDLKRRGRSSLVALAARHKMHKAQQGRARAAAVEAGYTQAEQVPGMKVLSSGGMGSVMAAKYRRADGSQQDQVYKADERPDLMAMMMAGASHDIAKPMDWNGKYGGTDILYPNLGGRSVASSMIDQATGLNALVKTHRAVRLGADGKEEIGQVMDRAKGKSTTSNLFNPIADDAERKTAHEMMSIPIHAGVGGEGSEWQEHAGQYQAMVGKRMQYAYRGDDGTATEANLQIMGDVKHNVTDYQHPNIQKNLAGLQLSDSITGAGQDRHSENMMIDNASGEVKGIDNDFSMGTQGGITGHDLGLPPIIDHEQYLKIKNFDWTKEFGKKLSGHVNFRDVAAAKKRMKKAQAHVETLRQTGMVVGAPDHGDYPKAKHASWGEGTYDFSMQSKGHTKGVDRPTQHNTYLGRDARAHAKHLDVDATKKGAFRALL